MFNFKFAALVASVFFCTIFLFAPHIDSNQIRRKFGIVVQLPVHAHTTAGHNHLDTALLEGDESIRPLNDTEVAQYVRAVVHPDQTDLPMLECAANSNLTRYEELKVTDGYGMRKYIFTFNLHENLEVLPRLMSTTLQAIKFLGVDNCAVSVMEGRSEDGTFQVLEALGPMFAKAGVPFFLETSMIDPYGGDGKHRIERLSALRNLALEPLFSNRFDFDPLTAKILFINDVHLCIEDVLEMLFQHERQDAAMSCAMDWNAGGQRFRDLWIARSMVGNLFLEVTHDSNWDHTDELFFDDPASRDAWRDRNPFQVYSCWNGMAVIDAEPFVQHGVRFRGREDPEECDNGEPTFLCKDLWRLGGRFGRIQVVPSVNVAYDAGESEDAKREQGWVTDYVDTSDPAEHLQTAEVEWQSSPPGLVKCVNMGFGGHRWVSPI